jgi:hypothetical protein
MSGPKVFYVVTREELLARCEAQLRLLDAAIAEWKRTCELNGAGSAKEIDDVAARRSALRGLLSAERFAELQKQVAAEISFLRADAQHRLERAAAAAAEARQARRRTERTARMLLEALERSGRTVPDDVRRGLQSAGEQAPAAISAAFGLLSANPAGGGTTERQRELASRLGRDEKRRTLEEWVAAQPALPGEEAGLRIDRHLAELSALGIDTQPFEVRASVAAAEGPPRQALLADSLLVDLARAIKEGRERASRLADLRQRAAELSTYESSKARALRERVAAALLAEDAASAPDLIRHADAMVAEELHVLAAAARRRAVLQGLASLGYEVNEGMATAWVQGGRVVLRKAANPHYGVELSGGTQSDRLQVRAVGFGSPQMARNAARDRDIETAWCGEFEKLQALLAGSGGRLEIETALPPGAVPIKLVSDPSGRDEAVTDAPTLRNFPSR